MQVRNIKKRQALIIGLILLALLVYLNSRKEKTDLSPKPHPVRISEAVQADVPRYFTGLGTVSPLQDTIVQSRVDGYLVAIHFSEGQEVKAGDLLIEIDPRPFLVQLEQAKGALAKDEAQLKNALLDLERYRKLLKQDAIPAQQFQQQEALAGQYEGAVQQDRAAIADARLKLTYSKVTAPISGIAGLRQLDIGATVRSSDTNGIVRITQTKPTYVLFTLVDKYLPDLRRSMREIAEKHLDTEKSTSPENKNSLAEISNKETEKFYAPKTEKTNEADQNLEKNSPSMQKADDVLAASKVFSASKEEEEEEEYKMPAYGLKTEIWSQNGKELLATGLLESIDNQIDSSTGTVKAKAIIPNEKYELFPNQFVNVRLLVETLKDVLTIPTSAVQRGSEGFFVYKIEDMKAYPTKIKTGYSNDQITVVEEGIKAGDLLVTDGVDRLREGSNVRY